MTERMTDTPRRTYYFTRGRKLLLLSLWEHQYHDDLDGKLSMNSLNQLSTTTQTL